MKGITKEIEWYQPIIEATIKENNPRKERSFGTSAVETTKNRCSEIFTEQWEIVW